MVIAEQIQQLRVLMQAKGLQAYIIPGNDPHASEYMAPHWQEMQWISGFHGESGTIVVTHDKALLWTDSRYYLQATAELAGTGIELMRESDVDCPSISEWLCKNIQGLVGVNPEMYSVRDFADLSQTLAEGGLGMQSLDLIAPLWTENRPAMPASKIEVYGEQYAGESAVSKLQRVRNALQERRCDALVVSALDEIGWLLNIRGKDVDYTPCVVAYVIVEMERCTLFTAAEKLTDETRSYFAQIGVTAAPYEQVFDALRALKAKAILIDGARVNEGLCEAIAPSVRKQLQTPGIVQWLMSTKNATEIEGEKRAMSQDGVAMVRFLRWLYEEAMQQPQTEVTLADKLHTFRAQGATFRDESFATIAGWQGNGAIVHYSAQPETCARIEGDGVLLLDSGGQYLDGTTDLTRTLWIGDEKRIPANLKHDYTLVMKGHIALACARFPKGTRGNQLDILAHQYMWQEGISYGHGTGHGVGHYMGCHEGPSNIRTDNNPNPIRLGQVFSDEPGIYRANEYGIRIENLITAIEAPQTARTTGETYYAFEVLTLCPYDTRLLEIDMLTVEEKAWINAYHERVYRELSPLLNNEDKDFLKQQTHTI